MVSQAQDATPPALASDERGYQVDDLIIDVGSQRVTRSGTLIALPALSFDLLVALVRAAPNLVSFEQLSERVWPGLLATPETIIQRVKLVRNALGDDPHAPRYIEAVRGRGYRMVAHVTPLTERHGAAASIPRLKEQKEEDAPRVQTSATAKPMSSGHEPAVRDEATSSTATTTDAVRRPRLSALALIAALAVAALLTGAYALWRARPGASVSSVRVDAPSQSGLPANVASTGAAAFSPPPHSIAVLPFVNISGDKEQEYFSDGLTEELLNDLARINELQVAARTSAFSFKGKDTDLSTIARKLNVASVLEGSVRRSGHTIRVTAQLNNAVTGYHLWSQTYDRELGDVLKLQSEIASAVASALKVTLLQEVAAEMNVGGTHNPAAYDAYLRSASAYWQVVSARDSESVRAGYREAVRLDPNFALAYADWSIALSAYATLFARGPAVGDYIRQAQVPALKAVALAPELAEGHLALALARQNSLDFAGASDEFQRAMTLAPGNARILRDYSALAVAVGRTDAGLTAARRAVALDPLNENSYGFLSSALLSARRYDEALAAYHNWLSLRPKDPQWPAGNAQLIYYVLGDFEKMRTLCEGVGESVKDFHDCLALAYHKLGRQADAETALARFKALEGNAGAYSYATIYAQWDNRPKALEWLDTAMRSRNPDLLNLKTDPLLDPLRNEPRFQAVMQELKFPN